MKNKSIIFIGIITGLLAVIIVSGIYIRTHKLDNFKKQGVETDATITEIVSKRELKVSGNRKYSKYIEVTFHTQVQKNDSLNDKKVIEKDESGNYKLNLDKYKIELGNFIKTNIEITSSQMKKFKKGDKVQIIYLPENPENAILKEDIE